MLDCRKIDSLLSGYLDGELTQGDCQRVEVHLDSCDKCRAAYDDMTRVRQAISQIALEELSQREWSEIMKDVTVRTSRGFGWLFYVVGLLAIVGFAGYQFAIDDAVPALIKSGVAAVVLGTGLLFLSVLRERLLTRKNDKYEDVQL